MTVELITSAWSADEISLFDRVAQALAASGSFFEEVMYWRCHTHRKEGVSRIVADSKEDVLAIGSDLSSLWSASLGPSGTDGIPAEQLMVAAGLYSEAHGDGVRVYTDEHVFRVECEASDLDGYLSRHRARYHDLVRALGRCSAIGGVWFRDRSAFAGHPAWLFEPKTPFAKLYDPVRYDQVTEEVKKIRAALCAAVSPDDIQNMLRDLGAEPEALGSDRIFVSLGDPKGSDAKVLLKKLEKKLSAALK